MKRRKTMSDTIRVQVTDPSAADHGAQYETAPDAHMVQTRLEMGTLTQLLHVQLLNGTFGWCLMNPEMRAQLAAGSIHEHPAPEEDS